MKKKIYIDIERCADVGFGLISHKGTFDVKIDGGFCVIEVSGRSVEDVLNDARIEFYNLCDTRTLQKNIFVFLADPLTEPKNLGWWKKLYYSIRYPLTKELSMVVAEAMKKQKRRNRREGIKTLNQMI